jgi:hypothetical protein
VISADIYGKDTINLDWLVGMHTRGEYDTSLYTAWESPDPGFWVPNGYAVVKAGLRGTSGSTGSLSPMSKVEAQDYYDLVEWAAVQPWSTGAVGSTGVSYLAMTQWQMAALAPPHLKAAVPFEGVVDMYREWSFHGGIPETSFSRNWLIATRARCPGIDVEDMDQARADHPLYDEYWAAKMPVLANITVPIYIGGSWSTQGLHSRGTLGAFSAVSSTHRWLEVHGRKEWEHYYSRQCLERQKRFFDYFLKGVENEWLATPRVRLEVRECFYEGDVRAEQEWPLARTQYRPLYLDGPSGRLVPKALSKEGAVSYATVAPESEASFTITFDEDTELTGHTKARLWLSSDAGDDMDVFVALQKLDRRGDQVHFPDFNHSEDGRVASGWLRVSHRELDEQRSTPQQPWHAHQRQLKITPGEIVMAEVEILASSTVFRAGESLRLIVRGSEIAPLGQGWRSYGHTELVNEGVHTIHTGGPYDSHLLVPVIPPVAR